MERPRRPIAWPMLILAIAAAARAEPIDPAAAEAAILRRIVAPTFADRDFPIVDFGALPDADCTRAIADAIAACHGAGGGRVVVPAGTWLTGPVVLKSNVNLHIAAGATLRFSTDPARYLPRVLTRFEGMECMNYSPLIYALDQENVAVTGAGTLDGGSSYDNWWIWKDKTRRIEARRRLGEQATAGLPVAERIYGDGSFLRPSFVQPYRCKNVLIEGVRIVGSPMWVVHPVLCGNVTVRGVTVDSPGPNNDGCDPESCRDVLIEDGTFSTGDDCIAIKSGRNDDGRRVNVPTENVVIRRCTMRDGHGGVTFGSEMTGGVRNVFVADCTLDSPNLDRAIRFKSNAARGGVLENIFIRNLTIGRVKRAVLSIEFDYEEGARGDHAPTLRNVDVSNVTCASAGRAFVITSIPAAIIQDVRVRDSTFRGVEADDLIRNASPPRLENVTIERKP